MSRKFSIRKDASVSPFRTEEFSSADTGYRKNHGKKESEAKTEREKCEAKTGYDVE